MTHLVCLWVYRWSHFSSFLLNQRDTLLHWPEGERLFLQWEEKVLWSRASDWKEWKEGAWKVGGSIRESESKRGRVGRVFRCRKNHFNFILRACSRMDMFIYAGCLKKHWPHTHTHTHMEPPLTLHAPTVSAIYFSAVLVHLFQLKCSLLASLSPFKFSVLFWRTVAALHWKVSV